MAVGRKFLGSVLAAVHTSAVAFLPFFEKTVQSVPRRPNLLNPKALYVSLLASTYTSSKQPGEGNRS